MLAGALVLGVGGSATLAAWTDQELASTAVTAGTFSLASRTATSDPFLSHGGGSEGTASMSFNATGLYPGQIRSAWIQIQNTGSVPGSVNLTAVNVAASGTASTTLSEAIQVRYVPVAAPGDMSTCTTNTAGGTLVTGLASLPSLTPITVAAGATVGYCMVLTLPSTAPSGAQGGSAIPTWTFTGTTG
ncbi:SipW-dependent-type signal peptide-containing protein [Microbacterium sp. M28]|uniref:SipW-dependent-type signal peptide-containing protein n=1 Tax=Microbacterium sp. M28 TaxID=2962064 RepID=UPI0021F4C9D9|nr:SipW-dependent-type signal peptide-containing protein [Microbacterium sp. M28]UYO95851.1 SipW-dependent-type signal peptide-containing protein [Microbacterium sp. M28]